MHRLLKRQLQRIYGKGVIVEALSPHEQQLFELLSETYDEIDRERRFYEHTLDVNSRELNSKNGAIQRALSSLAEAQRLSHTGSWLLQLEGEEPLLEWSDELYRIFGLDPHQPLPPRAELIAIIHPDDREQSDCDLKQTLAEAHLTFAYRLLLSDGTLKYVNEQRETLYSDTGSPFAIRGTIQDVTAQRQAEDELRLYATVFRHSVEPILITDSQNRIIAVNQSFTDVTGYTHAEVYLQNPALLSAGEENDDYLYSQMWRDLQERGYWQGELLNRKKGGEVYPAWMSISISTDHLGATQHYIANFSDITDRKASQDQIHYLAHHDALTGLINRFSLEERLTQSLFTSRRNQHQLALMFIDMDRFKIINDTLGHQAGDALLIEVAARLTMAVRECDIVARIGGDEFVVVLTGLDDGLNAAPIARFITHILSQSYTINEQRVFSSPSIGISLFPNDGDTVEVLMKNADSAMYLAKELGRNNYQFFTEALNRDAQERLQLESDLRHAIDENQFELFYQPQVCGHNGEVCGVEALVRWRHPTRGLIPPDKFIPLAEETKLIIPLGLWVLEQACRQQQIWRQHYTKRIPIAVNLSAQQLMANDLVDRIRSCLDRYQLEPGDLELEITESTAMQNPKKAISRLNEIRNLGIELAIDDFGTGYSSLSYLKLLPIQTLKLDRAFVSELEKDPNDAAICSAALALAHNLGLSVVAEGVENQQQQQFLADHQCEVLQGYYFSRPLPIQEVTHFIFGTD